MPSVSPLIVVLSGGRTATLRPADKGFPDHVRVKIEGGGTIPFNDSHWHVTSSTARDRVAKRARLSEADVDIIADKHAEWSTGVVAEREAEKQNAKLASTTHHAAPYGITLRTINQPRSEARSFLTTASAGEVVELLKQRHQPDDSVLEWHADQLDRLAMLDLDFHRSDRPKPTDADIDEIGYSLSPVPWCWWRTQGGGLHALYAHTELSIFTARELAAGAMAQVLVNPVVVRCGGTMEILNRTRHPGARQKGSACGPLHVSIPDETFACLARFSAAQATPEEVDDVLDQNGLAIGQRVDHSFCLIDPTHASTSQTPVIVMDTGMYCHSCAGRLGDGFRSWGRIRREFGLETSGTTGVEPVLEATRAFVHFQHVDYLIAALAPEIPEQCREALYSALLKQQHGNSPKHPSAFKPFYFVRGLGTWLHADTLLAVGKPLVPADISVLPSVQTIDDDGDSHMIQSLMSAHVNDGNVPGWTPILPRLFTPIATVHNLPKLNDGEVSCAPKRPQSTKPHVEYLAPDKRIPMVEAEKRILDYFPGISMTYVKLLIVAMGCAESGEGSVPIVWATGQTGAAKTTTIRMVLQMFGDRYEDLAAVQDDRLGQLFGESLSSTRLIMFDDFAKNPEDYPKFARFVLRLNRDGHTFHDLYNGKATPPVNSALVLTDWRTPDYFTQEKQFARRVHFIKLEQRIPVSWESLGHFVESWWTKTDELRDAACSFYSHLVDEFFPAANNESFDVKAQRLGITTLEQVVNPDIDERKSSLRELVVELAHAVCNARDLDEAMTRRIGTGYREVSWGTGNPLGQTCTALVDSLGDVPEDQENLQHVLESFNLELKEMLGLVCSASFQLRSYGKKLFIRMVEDGALVRSKSKRINRDLFPDKANPPAAEPPTTPPPVPPTGEPAAETLPVEAIKEVEAVIDYNPRWNVPQSMNGTEETVYIDYETQSACDLKKHGAYAYAEHPTTRVICAAIWVNGYKIFWTKDQFELRMPEGVMYRHGIEFLYELITGRPVTWVAHNQPFERSITKYCLKLPDPAAWIDTADMTRMHGLPAGADAAGEYLLNKGKDKEGYALMMKTCKPDRRGWMPEINQSIMQRYVQYNFRDVEIQVGISDRFGIDVQPKWEADVLTMSHDINHRGMKVDKEFAETLRSFDELFKIKAVEEVERITAQYSPNDKLTRADLSRNDFLRKWCGRRNLHLDDMKQDTIEQVLEAADEWEIDLPVEVYSVLQNRMVVTRAALSKVDTALRWTNSDGRIRAMLRAHAAHTGRWGGSGPQPQNLKRPDEAFDIAGAISAVESKDIERFKALCIDQKSGESMPPYELLGSLIRGIFVAEPGHMLLPSDFEQIEARNALWMVEDWDGLQEHIDYDSGIGEDVYVCLARTIYKDMTLTKKDKKKRQGGKIGELACTYGGSAGAVNRFAYSFGVNFADLGIDPMDIVNAWRAKRTKVVQSWGLIQTAFNRALGARGKEFHACRCTFRSYQDRTEILLPSGRSLYYMNARMAPSTRPGWEDQLVITYDTAFKGKTLSHETYGAKLFENIVQAACRDLLAQAMLRVEAEGYKIVLHVHDELVPEVEDSRVDEAVKVIGQIMCDPPEWAKRMPLRGAPAPCRRYGK